MPLDFVIDRLDALPATRALAEGVPAPGTRLGISGLPGSSPAVLVAALARRLAQRVFVVITPTPTDAERWLADLRTLSGSAVALYPQREALGAEEPHFEIAGERVETLELLLSGQVRVLVTTARAAAERTGVPGFGCWSRPRAPPPSARGCLRRCRTCDWCWRPGVGRGWT